MQDSKLLKPSYALSALGAYLALIGTLAMTTARPAYTQGGERPAGPAVRVVNPATEPVPVSLRGAAQIDLP